MLPVLMLSDPLRPAHDSAPPADGGPALGPDEAAPIAGHATFDDLLKGLNPLHHIPVVGTIYRAVTGEEILPVFRVLGGALFGGPVGMITSAVMAAVEEFKPMERLGMAWRGEPDPFLTAEGSPDAERMRLAVAAYGAASHGGA